VAGTSKAQISTVVLKDCKLEAGQRTMAIKVACILMQKNEALRLQPWLDYHQHLFGAKSLFIFDNGSSIPSVIDALRKAASRGATVDWSHKEASDFKRKSIIAAELVHFLDANDPHDFYFFLDCDEFVACEVNGEPRFDRNSILATLNPYANYKGVLLINGKYRNNPYMPNKYTRIEYSPKCFFARGALKSLASGYHDGESRFSKEKIGTPIIFFEFHYLPYKTHLGLSKQKLVHRTDDLSRRALAIYAKNVERATIAPMTYWKRNTNMPQSFWNQNAWFACLPCSRSLSARALPISKCLPPRGPWGTGTICGY
jgi:hypothetical protein